MDHLLQLPDQLGLHLKSLRKAAGVSQVQLAQRLGVSQSRVAAIERDPAAISVRQLMEIVQLLDADLLVRPRGDAPSPVLRVAEPAPRYAQDASGRPPAGGGDVEVPVPGPADRAVAFKPQALPSGWQASKPKGSW
ncbi:antitoxin HipB [Delftia tsuruhatensis]|uniref:helix-turn-helix domain-containing protein n=1 Tax=Delftia tsuruhatensis TaxID=180282 RepID=UPI001E70633D|nr:helix-turn-helix transcriptional regulator [Delftia tsuruhatensis]CAB5719475.1 antitoxin HipB [Delftia tsuruhatensis]CAC9687927.1 antitoxin HipB [Delftia tsuruhatensis]